MPEVRELNNPPITEGLIDLRVDVCQFSREKLDGIADSVKADYPHRQDEQHFQTRLDTGGPGAAPKAQTQDLGLHGARFLTDDKLQIAQFRSDGFTLNRLKPYTGWDVVFPEAMRLWRLFVDVFKPETVKRIAVRYVNHIPFDGMRVDLEDYLLAPVPTPPATEGTITSFLTSVVLRSPDSSNSLKITQSLQPPHSGPDLVLLLDIEAWQNGEWNSEDSDIHAAFEQLRDLKNTAFFSSLTETVIKNFE